MNSTIRFCAFDLGGVLFADGTRALPDSGRLAPEHRAAIALLRAPEAKALRAGTMDEDAFWRWAAPRLPAGLTCDALRDAWYASYAPDPEIFSLLRELHDAEVPLVAFSGNIRSRVEHLDARHPFRHLFRHEVWSYEHGVTKPDPRFVEILLEVLGCPPPAIAYVDDKDSALAPARARGVVGIRYDRGAIGPLRRALRSLGLPVTAPGDAD
ncbi:MAG: HAD hydrolase-like protein [Myxococcales bacterium]|nr:HAD hydrolase-like protein [Myxococcales bacterium]MCB9749393.1 HAD hydrolase-like protein [Myxococcales bacterium]